MPDPAPQTAPPPSARDVLKNLRLSRPATGLLTGDPGADEFLTLLAERGQYIDAVRFAARRLPPREAVWWGCLCVRHTRPGSPSAEDATALKAATYWVVHPGAATQKEARTAAAATERGAPSGLLARAASRAGGKSPLTTCKLAGAAVLFAATLRPAAEREQTYREFLSLAADVAAGRLLWEKPAPPKPEASAAW